MNREKLPFRKNCEGYFLDRDNKILARKTEFGVIVFPGGGVDEGENVEGAMIRETLEETGAVINNLKFLGNLKFVWGENWAQTKKQKERFKQFQGEDMYFFTGKIIGFKKSYLTEEDAWHKNKFMEIKEVIESIKSQLNNKSVANYRKAQFKFLNQIFTDVKNL